jgi:hypothetical protein
MKLNMYLHNIFSCRCYNLLLQLIATKIETQYSSVDIHRLLTLMEFGRFWFMQLLCNHKIRANSRTPKRRSKLCPYPIFSFAPQIFHEFITSKTHRINSLPGRRVWISEDFDEPLDVISNPAIIKNKLD